MFEGWGEKKNGSAIHSEVKWYPRGQFTMFCPEEVHHRRIQSISVAPNKKHKHKAWSIQVAL